MRIAVTGANGFIGQNLRVRLQELGHSSVASVTRETTDSQLRATLAATDFIFHLAGVNRPTEVSEFREVNAHFTRTVCEVLRAAGGRAAMAYVSSAQAVGDSPYGISKREGEKAAEEYGAATNAPVFIFRLSNVFGKWARPNYNSAVATFCHNIARGLPITVNGAATPLTLVYIDDVVAALVRLLEPPLRQPGLVEIEQTYATTLGEVVSIIEACARSRDTLVVPEVGSGLTRALYATYLSYLRSDEFDYGLTRHSDPRGSFTEVLKTHRSGQFSFFTARPGITRGEHYHHTKTEKFLVVKGRARFDFRHLMTDEAHTIDVEDSEPRIVETVPGWAHCITNVGDSEMVVLLWANEVFDPAKPDTIPATVTL